MFQEKSNRLLLHSTSGSNRSGKSIRGLIEFVIRQRLVLSLDGDPVRKLADDLLKPLRNRLLNLFLGEFDKSPRSMKTHCPNRLLLQRGLESRFGRMIH